MALTVGSRLGHYDVTALIGEGGMGQVYQATDTKLNRQVALKILPEAFAADPDRLARFQREAQVLASLNHPNIAAIHGLEDSEGTKALVLELVEGPTLADRIAQGPIPVDEALPIAKQIAEALEAAHDAGVIHRDLKPANVKVRPDGMVKVLDFGLAKAFEPDASDVSASMSQSPTISLTAASTQMGMVIGTAAYMAPEQAKGKVVDKRADVWAFGAVLYEMLTGRKPFVGDDVSDTLALVLKFEPKWGALPGDTPPRARQLIQTCLQKDPKQRVHDIADVRLAMEGAFESVVTAADESAGAPKSRVWQQPIPLVLAGSVLLFVGMLAGRPFGGNTPGPLPSPQRFIVTLPESHLMRPQDGSLLALSPDGETLIYQAQLGGTRQLFRRPIDEFGATAISNTVGGARPFVSPDGQFVGFQGVASRSLQRVGLLGGPSQTLVTGLTSNINGASWTSNDAIIYGLWQPGGALMQASANGETTALFTPNDQRQAWYPQVLSESDSVLFTLSDAAPDTGELRLLNLETGEDRLLLAGASAGLVLDTGHLVFVRSGALWAVPFDRERLEVLGSPVPVVEGVGVVAAGLVHYAVADSGTLAYLPGGVAAGNQQLVWVDRTGAEERLPAPANDYRTVSLSPSGTRAAVSIGSGNSDIWISELSRGTLERLTTDEAADTNPLWTQDGSSVVFVSGRNGRPEVFRKLADGSGRAERLFTVDDSVLDIVPGGWSPDGETLFARADFPETGRDIGIVSMSGSGTWEPILQSAANEFNPAISPNGEWLAYASNETGRNEIYVRRFPQLDGRTQVSLGGGFRPSWSKGGQEILFLGASIGPAETVMRVTLDFDESNPPSVTPGTPEKLFDWRYRLVVGGRRHHDVLLDGSQFLMITRGEDYVGEGGRAEINVVLNWHEELKRLVPIP